MRNITKWLRYLWFNDDGFFGIGMGPSSAEKTQAGELSSLADFATSHGEGDISQADNFWKSILSGDPSKISQVLGPELSGINKRGQEAKKTASEFHNRGGGTNAGEQMADDTTRSSVDSMISSLTGTAASALGASGSSLLAAGASAHEEAFSEADKLHLERMAQINDLFKSIVSVAAAPFTGGSSLGFGKLSKPGSGGGGDLSGDHGDFGGET